jgi:hypothetical protein
MAISNICPTVIALIRGAQADLERNTLGRIPSVLGRLSFLASTWDCDSETYRHYGLESIFGQTETARALKSAHNEVFRQWLGFSLSRQRRDLDLYLRVFAKDCDRRRELFWLEKHCSTLVPDGSEPFEKRLLLTNFRVLIELALKWTK